MIGKYAKVIIDISHEKIDRPFCYKIPEHLRKEIMVGCAVLVPFGMGDKKRRGYVIDISDTADFSPERLKEIYEIEDGINVENKLINLAFFLKEQYGCTMIQALQTVLPVRKKIKEKEESIIVRKASREEILKRLEVFEKKKQNGKVRVLKELLEHSRIPKQLLTGKLHVSPSTLKSLEKDLLIETICKRDYRNPLKEQQALPSETHEPPLSEGQKSIVNEIMEDYNQGIKKTYLLHGITGSGKTRVYIELIERIVRQNKKVIMMIPEISLTFQTVMRFRKRFGDRVSILNSSLSQGEKYDQCERAAKGELDIMIGPRSALFTPFDEIGLIVIDEEHESSYKSESMPKYHVREVAEKLASLHSASLLLGSATPSMESYYKAATGEYKLFRLKERLTGGMLPKVYIEDLRKEFRRGNKSIFSFKLQELIKDRLEKKEQIMLFLNRRGYTGFISCRSCGEIIKCPHCDVSLTYHKDGRMVCHYCGYHCKTITKCPGCTSPFLSGFKVGTQKIEEEFKRLFGEVPILRMDKDTTGKKDSYEKILSDFMEEKAQVLIGTQMIVKGHDFPRVTLVGILAADLSLGINDYRAGERTFQLLTQAAGRAGRGSLPGEVVIQSYQPEHYSIRLSAAQDYENFFKEELIYRRLGGYPPVCHMLTVQIYHDDRKKALELGNELKEAVRSYAVEKGIYVIGPAEASVNKINDVYRFGLILKSVSKEVLIRSSEIMEERLGTCENKEKIVQFDFNPINSF